MATHDEAAPLPGLFQRIREAMAEVPMTLKQQMAVLREDVAEDARKAKNAGMLLTVGGIVALVGSMLLCLTLIHFSAWAMPSVPGWVWYGVVGAPLTIAGSFVLLRGVDSAKKLNVFQDRSSRAVEEIGKTVRNVNETAHMITDSIESTVQSAKNAVDMEIQVRRRPWTMVGGAILVGYIGGSLLRRSNGNGSHGLHEPIAQFVSPNAEAGTTQQFATAPKHEPGVTSRLLKTFDTELAQLKGLAIGVLVGLLRDVVSNNIPRPIERSMSDVFNGVTEKLGGHRIDSPILGEGASSERRV